jgi:serine/threonine protein kinase
MDSKKVPESLFLAVPVPAHRFLREAITTGKTGTQRYMAPENWRAQNYSPKVDVFSFAIIAWELLAKKRAYTHLYFTAEQIAAGVAERGLRPPLNPVWPADLRALLEESWAEDPEKRPSFAEIARRLEALKAAYGDRLSLDKVSRGRSSSLKGVTVPKPRR